MNEIINLKLEHSRGVRRCRKCKVSLHPGVLTLNLVRVITCKFSKTGQAYQKEYYCLICAEDFIKEIISSKREEILRWKNNRYHAPKKIAMLQSTFKDYKKTLKEVQNWKKYFAQITDQEIRKYKLV
jgi:hypothetical protein